MSTFCPIKPQIIIKPLVSIVLTVILVSYLSGLFFMSFFGLPISECRPWSIYQYWSIYSVSNQKYVKFICAISLFGPWILCAYFAYLIFGKEKRKLHGDARFATKEEIKDKKLLGLPQNKMDRTILVGKYKDSYLTFGGNEFVLLAAPTRSGKGVGIVIPNCLNFSDSIVVLDIKLENYRITSGWRAHCGQEVYLFCPFDQDGRTHRYNPLSYISKDPKFQMGDIDAIANALYPDNTPQDKFWNEQAKDLLRGMCLFVLETPEIPHTFGEILRQASGQGKPLKEHIRDTIIARQDGDHPFSAACVDCLNRIINAPDNTFGSIVSTFNTPLKLFQNPLVDAATSDNDFDLRDVRKKKMSIYFGITPDKLSDAAVLVNLFFDQMINQNSRQLPEDNPDVLKYQCLLIMDEFTAIGKVNMIAKSVSYQAGFNMRLLTIVQNKSQLEDVYGKSGAHTLITNHAVMIIYRPASTSHQDAQEYSEIMGYQTVKSHSRSYSFGRGGNSESVSDQKRALILPQELREMDQKDEILCLSGLKPVYCEKIIYYEDPKFKSIAYGDRLDGIYGPAPVPTQDIDGFIAVIEDRYRDFKEGDGETKDGHTVKLKGSDSGKEINEDDFDDSMNEDQVDLFLNETIELKYSSTIVLRGKANNDSEISKAADDIFANAPESTGEEAEEEEIEVIFTENPVANKQEQEAADDPGLDEQETTVTTNKEEFDSKSDVTETPHTEAAAADEKTKVEQKNTGALSTKSALDKLMNSDIDSLLGGQNPFDFKK